MDCLFIFTGLEDLDEVGRVEDAVVVGIAHEAVFVPGDLVVGDAERTSMSPSPSRSAA